MVTPLWRVDDYTHQTTCNETSDGQGDEPTQVAPGDHSPIDRSPITVAKTDTDCGTDDTLGG